MQAATTTYDAIHILAGRLGLKEDRLRHICTRILSTPYRTRTLARACGCSIDTCERYLYWLRRAGWTEKAKGTTFYQVTGKQYRLASEIDPARISYPLFRTLPLMQDWYGDIDGKRHSLKLIKDFFRICSGKVVQSFTCLPEKWAFEENTRDFISKYCQTFKRVPPENIIKALRTFCVKYLNVSRDAFRILVKQELQRNGYSFVNHNYGRHHFAEMQNS